MEKPELIEQKIKDLRAELVLSKRHYRFTFICSSSEQSNKMIGSFNIGNGEKILTLLNDGKKLQLCHGILGHINVWMNPQRNRILVSENANINEDNIMSYIIWHTGEWYLDTEG